MKKKSTTTVGEVCEVLPRRDLADEDIAQKVLECSGFPSKVADALGMSVPDGSSRAGKGEQEDRRRVHGGATAASGLYEDGRDEGCARRKVTPPDPAMMRWFISRYE